jgi:hypothetical protein
VFANAAAHLQPAGMFVLEVIVPQLRRVPPGEVARVLGLDREHVGIETFEDLVGQVAWSHHWFEVEGRLVRHSAPYRYVLAGRTRPDGSARGSTAVRALVWLGSAAPSPRTVRARSSCMRRRRRTQFPPAVSERNSARPLIRHPLVQAVVARGGFPPRVANRINESPAGGPRLPGPGGVLEANVPPVGPQRPSDRQAKSALPLSRSRASSSLVNRTNRMTQRACGSGA